MLNLTFSFSAATSLGIVGYGKTKQTIFNTNNKLNKGEVMVWSPQECERALELFNQRPIKETNICAGQFKSNDIWIGSCTDKVLLFDMPVFHIILIHANIVGTIFIVGVFILPREIWGVLFSHVEES